MSLPNTATLTASVKAKMLAKLDGIADVPDLDGMCEAIAETILETLAAGVVTFPAAAIQVTGTAAAQANPAPVTGGTIS